MNLQKRREQFRLNIRKQQIENFKKKKRIELMRQNQPSEKSLQHINILTHPQEAHDSLDWLQKFREALDQDDCLLYLQDPNQHLSKLLGFTHYKNEGLKAEQIWIESVGMIFYIAQSSKINPRIVFEITQRLKKWVIRAIGDYYTLSVISDKSLQSLRNISCTSSPKLMQVLVKDCQILNLLDMKLEAPSSNKEKESMLAIYLGVIIYIFKNEVKPQEFMKGSQNSLFDVHRVCILSALTQQNTSLTCIGKGIDIAFILTKHSDSLTQASKKNLIQAVMNILSTIRFNMNPIDLILPENYQTEQQMPESCLQFLLEAFLQKFANQLKDYQRSHAYDIIFRILEENYLMEYTKKRRAIINCCSYLVSAFSNTKDSGITQLAYQLVQKIFSVLEQNEEKQEYAFLYFLSSVLQDQHFTKQIILSSQNEDGSYLQNVIDFLGIIQLEKDPKVNEIYLLACNCLVNYVEFDGRFDQIIQKIEGILYGNNQKLTKQADILLKKIESNRKGKMFEST